MTSTELVGPMQRVRFGEYRDNIFHFVPRLPRDTMDPRVRLCWDHRTACDCREALLSENLREVDHERRSLVAALEKRIAGHPTYVFPAGGLPGQGGAYDCNLRLLHYAADPLDTVEVSDPCSCIGCQVWREARPW